jgi:cyclophilin family peptidyl-prolyl cis-trans isomerase
MNIESRYLRRLIIELYGDCPNTSNNFLSLCKGFRNEKGNLVSFEGSTIHRVVRNSFIQGGDLSHIGIVY